MSRFSVRSWKLVLPLAVFAVAALSTLASGVARGAAANEVRVAIMTDCKGAFGFGYEPDIGGAQAAFAQYAGGKPKNKKKPSAGMTGIKAGGKNVQIVGYGCGDDTPADRAHRDAAPDGAAERRRHGRPAVGRRGGRTSRTTRSRTRRRRSSSAPPARRIRRCRSRRRTSSATTATAPSGTPGIGEIVYKKLGWRQRRDHHGRLQLRLDVRGRHHRRLLRGRRQDHEARVPAAEHDRLLAVRPAAAAAEPGRRLLLGRRRHRHRRRAEGVRAGVRRANPKKHVGNLFFAFLGTSQGRRPAARRRVRRRLRHRAGAEDAGRRRRTSAIVQGATRAERRQLRRRLRLQLLQRRLGDSSRGSRSPAATSARRCRRALPRTLKSGLPGLERRRASSSTANRQAIQDQYPLQIVKDADGKPAASRRRLRPERRPVLRRPVQEDEPAAGSHAAAVREAEDCRGRARSGSSRTA